MKQIASFTTNEDAYLFRSFLGSRGIEAHIFGEHIVQWMWYYSNAMGGARVMVADEDEDEALALLETYRSSLASAPDLTPPPKVWPVVLLLSLLIGAPMMIFGRQKRP